VKTRTLAAGTAAVLLATVLVVAFWWARSPRATRVKKGTIAPDVELAWVEPVGSGHLLGARGSLMILGFFDSYTPRGQQLAKVLERVQGRFRSYGLVVVGVALDNDRTPLQRWLRQGPYTFLAFHDPGGARVASAWGPVRAGEAYLIDPRGRVVKVYPDGFGWPDRDVRETLLRILPPPPTERRP
jgi:peroxiredoxin